MFVNIFASQVNFMNQSDSTGIYFDFQPFVSRMTRTQQQYARDKHQGLETDNKKKSIYPNNNKTYPEEVLLLRLLILTSNRLHKFCYSGIHS